MPDTHLAQRWRAALYIRLSKEDGREESLSVTNQRALLTEFLSRHREEFSFYQVYIEM